MISSSLASSHHPTPQSIAKQAQMASPMVNESSIFVVESDRDSICSEWDDEHGITTLRRYYALRDEAQVTVDESKRVWIDTPFSLFALQCTCWSTRLLCRHACSRFCAVFQPPREPVAMQAMLVHSQKKLNYGPLPSELRPHRVRSRTSSKASPYPLRAIRAAISPGKPRSSPMQVFVEVPVKPASPVRQRQRADAAAAAWRDQAVLASQPRGGRVEAGQELDGSPYTPACDVGHAGLQRELGHHPYVE